MALTLVPGNVILEKIIVENVNSRSVNIEIKVQGLENFVEIVEKNFRLAPGEVKEILVSFKVPDEIISDLFVGKIVFSGKSIEREVLVAVGIESSESLFDVRAEIIENSKGFFSGGNVLANISLFDLADVGEVGVDMEYSLRDEFGKIISLYEEEVVTFDKKKTFLKSFELPYNIKKGSYVLHVKLRHGDKTASSSVWFSVKGRFTYLIILIVLLIIFILLIFLYFVKSTKNGERLRAKFKYQIIKFKRKLRKKLKRKNN